MGAVSVGQIAFEKFVKQSDVIGQCRGQLLGGAVLAGGGDAAHELAVVEGIVDGGAGKGLEMGVLQLLPQAEELGHALDKGHGLGAEQHRQLPYAVSCAPVQLHLIFHRGPVFILQGALQGHGIGIGGEEGHQVPGGGHQLLNGGEDLIDPLLGGGVVHILRQDLIYKIGAVGAHPVGQGVHFPHYFVV